MQTASPDPAHDTRGSTVFAEHMLDYYYNMSFDEEISYRQSFLDYLDGTPGGGPEHGSHEESNDPKFKYMIQRTTRQHGCPSR